MRKTNKRLIDGGARERKWVQTIEMNCRCKQQQKRTMIHLRSIRPGKLTHLKIFKHTHGKLDNPRERERASE